MNWEDFNCRHENCIEAFEAFGRQLFSKWCSHTYGQQIKSIIHVGGKGGDGGVEAFARKTDGTVIGFQAKWFRETFSGSQIDQINSSIKSARSRHSELSSYIVCMPYELQGSKGGGNKGTAQYERWEGLQSDISDIDLILWDDTEIEKISIEVEFSAFLNASDHQSVGIEY